MVKMYERFAPREYTFSYEAMKECHEWESKGKTISPNNGYAIGKKIMDITIAMWKEDLGKILFMEELQQDYPQWFLDKVLK